MMRTRISSTVDTEWWDARVRDVGGDFEQSSACAAYFCATTPGLRPHYMQVEDNDGTLLALALFFSEGYGQSGLTGRLPRWCSALTAPILRLTWKTCWLVHGPLILEPAREDEILKSFLAALNRFAQREHIFWWKSLAAPVRQPYSQMCWNARFEEADFSRSAWGTLLVDLTGDEETLWKQFKSSARKALKKMPREHLTFSEITDEAGLRKYYDMLQETRQRANLPIFGNFDALRRDFAACPDYRKFFLVEYDGIPLAAQGVVAYNGLVREIMIGVSNYAIDHKIYGGDFLKFEILKWGQRHSYTAYDLAGVNPKPGTQAEKNIRQFKAKWGGQYIEYPIYSKVYGTLRYKLLRTL